MKAVRILFLTGMLLHSTLSHGNASDINVTGMVVASPCIVDLVSARQTIDFGQLRHYNFSVAQSAGEWETLTVKLTTCPLSTSKVTMSFSGTASDDNASLHANNGTAKNIAVQLTDVTKEQTLGVGSSLTVVVDAATRTATLPLAARVFSEKGSAGAGTINAIVQLNFTYQ